jgi:beta-galactosidase
VVGFNYQPHAYDRFHKEHPEMKLSSSEDVSGLAVRGEYANNKEKHLIEDYDTQHPPWGLTHREAWQAIAERPFLAGAFVWTAFDYRGEPQPNEWPTAGASFGAMDLCGFPKTAFYIHQAQWVEDKPILTLIPHWNWPADSIGKNIRVMAMTNADRVKLFLNGKQIQDEAVDKYTQLTWKVPYQPGKLEAFGYKNGKEVSHFVVETTGAPAKIELIADRNTLAGEGWDATPVTVRVLDAQNRPVQNANLPITCLGNGDPNSHEAEKGNKRKLYSGLAQVILQTKAGGNGAMVLTAHAPGLQNGSLSIQVTPAIEVPHVAVISPSLILDKWTVSPIMQSRPDPNQGVSDFDMNTWAPTKPGQLQNMDSNGFIIFHTTFTPYAGQRANGGQIVLKGVTGTAEVYLDNKLIATKSDPTTADLTLDMPAGQGEHKLNIMMPAERAKKIGLGGIVEVKSIQ